VKKLLFIVILALTSCSSAVPKDRMLTEQAELLKRTAEISDVSVKSAKIEEEQRRMRVEINAVTSRVNILLAFVDTLIEKSPDAKKALALYLERVKKLEQEAQEKKNKSTEPVQTPAQTK